MNDYIERQIVENFLQIFLNGIKNAPATDVRPNVTGKWEVKEIQSLFPGMEEHPVYSCSVCGYQFWGILDTEEAKNFCPNCGAKMMKEV